jgi:hypothetical protein
MKNKSQKINVMMSILLLLLGTHAAGQFFLDVETGGVFSGYNDIRSPGDSGTQFSLSQDLKTESSVFFRFRLGVDIKDRHHLSLLIAPLTLEASGKVDKSITFFDEEFPSSIPLKGTYTFNSYRLTYRYKIFSKEKWNLGIGLTAKIRDAAVGLEGGGISSTKTNVGFVPLINFRLEWKFQKSLSLLLTGDALGASQGRAEDVLLALLYTLSDHIKLKAGYRIVEGGANVDEVYNFTLIHYALVGFTYSF